MTSDNPLMPILQATRLTGYTPFSVDHAGRLQYKMASVAFLWSVLSTSCLSLTIIYYIMAVTRWDFQDYSYTLFKFQESVIIVITVGPMFTSWASMGDLVTAVNEWNQLHRLLVAMTKTSRQSRVRFKSKAGVAVGVATTMAVNMVADWQENYSYAFPVIIYQVIAVLMVFNVLMVPWLWTVVCLMANDAFAAVTDDLASMAAHTAHHYTLFQVCGRPSVQQGCLRERRRLWLSLHRCSAHLVAGLARLIALWLLAILYLLCSCIYAMLTVHDPNMSYVEYCTNISVMVLLIYLIFMFSHSANNSISDNMVSTLYTFRRASMSERAMEEIDLFISTIQLSKPCFEIGGVLKFDKVQFLNIMITINTYVVVMLQFDQMVYHEKT